ncbi:MAG: T9SS type A sorting domain-containing protein [Bacteroidales bacterium]|nr:T9SS type A sorting domain-containing protein [Bacteroidales bacterium]
MPGKTGLFLPSVTIKDLYSVVFTSENNGYITGKDGTILMTADAGLHWTISVSGTSLNLWDVYFYDESIGFIAGDNGLILKTTNAGALGMPESELSKGNITVYPNPATEIINIEFNDQVSSGVKVAISGINGQLFWEKEFSPNEKIQVDISFLPKGAYLLRTETQAGVEITKVML